MGYDASAEITAHLAATPERVWSALTEPEALAAWYWPASTDPQVTSDPRPGGRFGITAGAADMGFSGVYREMDPPRRMVQSWRWAGDDRDSRVTISLTPADGGTDLLVVHDQVDAETAEAYRAGWASCLARLPGHLDGGVSAAGPGSR
jgi:uncharacterized protein YndB with AHSA1/START domain